MEAMPYINNKRTLYGNYNSRFTTFLESQRENLTESNNKPKRWGEPANQFMSPKVQVAYSVAICPV